MPFVLTLVDADGNLTESTLTLNRLRAEGLPRDLKTGDAGLHGFTLTPEPTNDEKFLFDEFTKLIERFDPLAGIHSAEIALAGAVEATNARIAERLSEAQVATSQDGLAKPRNLRSLRGEEMNAVQAKDLKCSVCRGEKLVEVTRDVEDGHGVLVIGGSVTVEEPGYKPEPYESIRVFCSRCGLVFHEDSLN